MRTGKTYRPPACCTYRRRRAACPWVPRMRCARGMRTSLGRIEPVALTRRARTRAFWPSSAAMRLPARCRCRGACRTCARRGAWGPYSAQRASTALTSRARYANLTLTSTSHPNLSPYPNPNPSPNPNPNQVECPEGFYCGEGSANATRCSADLGRSPEARCPPGSSEQPRRWSGLVIALLAVWPPTVVRGRVS